MRSKIKICGITRLEDALLAESLGTDFIGLILTAKSPRRVPVEAARDIARRLTRAKPIGVFVEQNYAETAALARNIGLAGVQHGTVFDRRPECEFYIHARPAGGDMTVGAVAADYTLFDTHKPGQHGGTGEAFDWSLLPPDRARIFLAGGINPRNVAKALAQYAYAIDLSSGVESAPGVKDHAKLKHLFTEIDHARQLL